MRCSTHSALTLDRAESGIGDGFAAAALGPSWPAALAAAVRSAPRPFEPTMWEDDDEEDEDFLDDDEDLDLGDEDDDDFFDDDEDDDVDEDEEALDDE